MKPKKYTIREVVGLLHQGRSGIAELLRNKVQLQEIHLALILELAVEYIAIGQADGIQQQSTK